MVLKERSSGSRKDHIREQGNHADRKQHTVKWREKCMEQLLIPGRRPFMCHLIRAILLPTRLGLLLRKTAFLAAAARVLPQARRRIAQAAVTWAVWS